MGKQHAAAAVALQAQRVQGIPLGVLGLQQAQVGLPLVADDLATREAANGDDHGGGAGATSFAARLLFYMSIQEGNFLLYHFVLLFINNLNSIA